MLLAAAPALGRLGPARAPSTTPSTTPRPTWVLESVLAVRPTFNAISNSPWLRPTSVRRYRPPRRWARRSWRAQPSQQTTRKFNREGPYRPHLPALSRRVPLCDPVAESNSCGCCSPLLVSKARSRARRPRGRAHPGRCRSRLEYGRSSAQCTLATASTSRYGPATRAPSPQPPAGRGGGRATRDGSTRRSKYSRRRLPSSAGSGIRVCWR